MQDCWRRRWWRCAARVRGEQLKELFGKVGEFYPNRENFRLTPDVKTKFVEKVKTDPAAVGGRKVTRSSAPRAQADSRRRFLGVLRLCGTEPVVRVYTEARKQSDADALSKAAKDWVLD